MRSAENHTSNAVAGKTGAKLPKPTAKRPAKWHPQWPSKLNQAKIPAESLAISSLQALQPIPNHVGP